MKFINTHPLLDHPILVVRPLLSLSKEEIENNCKEYNIKYFEDKTNFDTSTSLRNKIRHEFIIPLSQLSENNSFFKSWETIYKTLDYKKNNNNFLIPIPICPYRNAKSAYQREIPNNLINITTFTSTLENL
jgi:tRNA(Ile)-lysidine synthase TilS/MesJ